MLRRGERASRDAEKHIHIHTQAHTGTYRHTESESIEGREREDDVRGGTGFTLTGAARLRRRQSFRACAWYRMNLV